MTISLNMSNGVKATRSDLQRFMKKRQCGSRAAQFLSFTRALTEEEKITMKGFVESLLSLPAHIKMIVAGFVILHAVIMVAVCIVYRKEINSKDWAPFLKKLK